MQGFVFPTIKHQYEENNCVFSLGSYSDCGLDSLGVFCSLQVGLLENGQILSEKKVFQQESVGKLTSLSDGQDERARCKQDSSIANHITKHCCPV